MEYYLFTLLLVFIFMLLEGFFSGSEIALVAADKTKLRYQAKKGSKSAKLVIKLFRKPEWILSTTLTGTNISLVSATTLATAAMLTIFPKYGDLITVAILTPCTLFFAEVLSKSIFQQKADVLATKVVYPLYFASWLFAPVVLVMTFITSMVSKLFGIEGEVHSIFVSKDELKMVLDMAGKGSDVLQQERSIIQRLFEFSELTARESMIPLVDISAVVSTATIQEAIQSLNKTDFPWVFVYSKRIDLITGYIDYFDLLNMDKGDKIRPVIRPVYYIPPHKKLNALLVEMQERRVNFAVIVDEYGGAEGIITIEDILEEIVGDISDEHEKRQPLFVVVNENQYLLQARTEIHQFNEKNQFGLELPEEGLYATLGGFVVTQLDQIPEVGQSFVYQECLFSVEKADARSVIEIRITKIGEEEERRLSQPTDENAPKTELLKDLSEDYLDEFDSSEEVSSIAPEKKAEVENTQN
ncbi:hemolysin family protein [Deltaproteobacteria bacterium TL4]